MKWMAGALALALAVGGGYLAGRRGAAPHAGDAAEASATGERKILYYRNPMGLPDTSPVPKKDSMGMDYIPVYAGEEPESGSGLKISTEKMQKLGVRTEPAARRVLDRVLRAAARVEPDERRTHTVAPRFEGFIERLHVNATGQPVARGQVLFEAYSPELLAAQREYAVAIQGLEGLKDADEETKRGMQRLADAALARLRNLDVGDETLRDIGRAPAARHTVSVRAPVGGIVVEKKAVAGMRFMPGEGLYQITDLSAVWVVAQVPEQDIASVKTGMAARVQVTGLPGRSLQGRVAYIYPTLDEATRSVSVRIELANPGGMLKPAMFAQVELQPEGGGQPVLSVPQGAVLDSGTRTQVLVQTAPGRFAPREVKLGARGEQYVAVLEGLQEGEEVVVAANFLIDAESNLRAALGSFGAGAASAPAAAGPVHKAVGRIESLDPTAGGAMLQHEPVASLKWPAMTMEFKLANGALAKGLKAGQEVDFEFVERGQGEWVITRITPRQSTAPSASAPAAHKP